MRALKRSTRDKIRRYLEIQSQIKSALDGRTQRWLGFECRITDVVLSRKMQGHDDWKEEELKKIEKRLNFKFVNIER